MVPVAELAASVPGLPTRARLARRVERAGRGGLTGRLVEALVVRQHLGVDVVGARARRLGRDHLFHHGLGLRVVALLHLGLDGVEARQCRGRQDEHAQSGGHHQLAN